MAQSLAERILASIGTGKIPTELVGVTVSGAPNRTTAERIALAALTGKIPSELSQSLFNNQTLADSVFTFAGNGDDVIVSALGIAASRGKVATLLQGTPAVDGHTFIQEYWASPQGAINNLVTLDLGWYIADTNLVAAIPADINIKRYIEYPAGTFTQVRWGGSTTGTLLASTTAVLRSDAVPLIIPAGTRFWVRTVNITGASRQFPQGQLPDVPTNIGVTDGSDVTDKGNSGTIAPSSTSVGTFGPVAILGNVANFNPRGFIVHGDSIANGQGDISSVGAMGSSGWIRRALDQLYPSVAISKPGISAQALTAPTLKASINTLLAAISYTDVVAEAGINDLSQLSRTVVQVTGDQAVLYAQHTGKRIYQTTITPRTTSTDSYATAVNQTVKVDGTWPLLASLNAAIRALGAPVTGIIDAADFAMTARDTGIWSGPYPCTTDGTHPSSIKAAAMAALWTVS